MARRKPSAKKRSSPKRKRKAPAAKPSAKKSSPKPKRKAPAAKPRPPERAETLDKDPVRAAMARLRQRRLR